MCKTDELGTTIELLCYYYPQSKDILNSFHPTALKGSVFTHGDRMGGGGGGVGGWREKVCPGCISETVRCRKLILGRNIG